MWHLKVVRQIALCVKSASNYCAILQNSQVPFLGRLDKFLIVTALCFFLSGTASKYVKSNAAV